MTSKTVEADMLNHYNYIINIKKEELEELYDNVRYRERELKQLIENLEKMTTILSAPLAPL